MKKINFFIVTFILVFCSVGFAGENKILLLKNPIDALNSRVEVLLGRRLTEEELNSKNPYIEFDSSQTPKVKTIVLSTLLITHDYVGTLLLRLLEHHASKGASVYVMLTKRFIFNKEKEWLENFKKSSPNIHFVDYQNIEAKDLWSKIQSTSHVKVFLTEGENESDCRLISGGRNTSDMYFFNEKPDYSDKKELVQWGDKNYEWGYFDDLDVQTNDCKIVDKVKNTMFNYFQNYKDQLSVVDDDFVLSMNTDVSLEEKYISLIQSSEKSIKMLSPYINFTPKIYSALLEAKNRGVDIEIVTSKSLSNDYLPIFLQVQQNYNLRKAVKKFNIFLYENKSYIPHAKALLIDDKILSVGSVNMNRRSFIYDNEFTQFITDSDLIEQFQTLYKDNYKSFSSKIGSDYKFESSLLILPLKLFNNSF